MGGLRHGYGVRSVLRDGVQVKEYSGGWANNQKEVRASLRRARTLFLPIGSQQD